MLKNASVVRPGTRVLAGQKATGDGALQRSARNAGVHILEFSLALLNGKSVYDWMILLI